MHLQTNVENFTINVCHVISVSFVYSTEYTLHTADDTIKIIIIQYS